MDMGSALRKNGPLSKEFTGTESVDQRTETGNALATEHKAHYDGDNTTDQYTTSGAGNKPANLGNRSMTS